MIIFNKKLKTMRTYLDAVGKRNKLYSINENILTEKPPFFYYLLGLMSADGCIHTKYMFSISQSHESGKQLLELIKSELNYTGIVSLQKHDSYRLTISNVNFIKCFEEYGITQKKTLSFNLKKKLTEQEFLFFLQGYFDGDGSIGVYDNGRKQNIMYLCTSIVGTKEFINTLIEKIPIKGVITHIKRCKNLFELRFNGKKAEIFCAFLWNKNQDFISPYYKREIYENYLIKYQNKIEKRNIKNEILKLVLNGISVSEISKKFNVKPKTIWQLKYENKKRNFV